MLTQLLTTFSPMTIILCIIMIFLAFKAIMDYKTWMQSFANEAYKKRQDKEKELSDIQELKDSVNSIAEDISGIKVSLVKLSSQVDTLTESDKDDIKAFITREYHYFVEQVGWIDDYSMDCLEKRYAHYVAYRGNTFVGELMKALRALPRKYEDRIIRKDK